MGQQHLLVICAPSGVGKQVEHQRADIGKPVRGIGRLRRYQSLHCVVDQRADVESVGGQHRGLLEDRMGQQDEAFAVGGLGVGSVDQSGENFRSFPGPGVRAGHHHYVVPVRPIGGSSRSKPHSWVR